MCANYLPVTSLDRLLQYFGVVRDRDEPEHDLFPMGLAPFIWLAAKGKEGGPVPRFVGEAIFRFVPAFVQKVEWARRTYNARSETVDEKATFRKAWTDGQRCIIPADAFYEPNFEAGKAVRWRIKKANGEPTGIAGIFRTWT